MPAEPLAFALLLVTVTSRRVRLDLRLSTPAPNATEDETFPSRIVTPLIVASSGPVIWITRNGPPDLITVSPDPCPEIVTLFFSISRAPLVSV